jgi:RNA polymerase sigma-70 factor (family 1)
MPLIKSLSDNELVHLLKQGDREAFTEIYKRYAESLAGFAASKLYSLEDARDVLHDLFVKLWEDRGSLSISGGLQSYLFAAIRYRIIDKIRRNVTRQNYDALLQSLDERYSPGIEQQLEAKELQHLVDRSLESLSPKTKEIYLLSRNEHCTVAEIAQKLNLSEQTVKNQLTIALKHLRQSITVIGVTSLLINWLSK